ncbi:MAG: hypothetical protein C4521_04950 [Actinobacteria bacterium]|nr:MAG: hypothetical protein C4521_04950 [Actinomycetota bacterium]
MGQLDEDAARSVEYLAQRIVEALEVLERNDFFAARLILADLWQELEQALKSSAWPFDVEPSLSDLEKKRLRRRLDDLIVALRARPQSESQEMAMQLEEMLRR